MSDIYGRCSICGGLLTSDHVCSNIGFGTGDKIEYEIFLPPKNNELIPMSIAEIKELKTWRKEFKYERSYIKEVMRNEKDK